MICDQMGGAAAVANLFPSFAALCPHATAPTVAMYRAWLLRTRTWEFADQLHLSQLSRTLQMWITVVPVDDDWVVQEMNLCGVGADRRIFLANDDVHYVWLSPDNAAAAAAVQG